MPIISETDYLELLEKWVSFSQKDFYICPERPDLGCYGPGYNNWGVQTNQKAFAAYAVMAASPDFNEKRAGVEKLKVLDIALKTLRFSLESHRAGSFECTDGTKWGNTWISALGIERMMHGVDAIWEYLYDYDKELLRKVILSESDWLLDHYPVLAGPVENNKPESNLWNGAVLFRASVMYPDAKRVKEYREKAADFLVNSISVPLDAYSKENVLGREKRKRFKGYNFFESFALNHHHYLNVGYMVICLSNVAMLHFMYKDKGLKAPGVLYNHVKDLWKLVKMSTFPDGRLLRIGGDTRVRYCYCQDYAIPSWLLLNEHFKDRECVNFEAGWLEQVKKEMDDNGDGSFLSERCAELPGVSPLYYTRLEADRAGSLSMGAYWRSKFKIGSEGAKKATYEFPEWKDDYHGSVFTRNKDRVASFTWDAGEKPQGLFLSPGRSDMAEWKENLSGRICGTGRNNFQELISHKEHLFRNGFLTYGKTLFNSAGMAGEGQKDEKTAIQNLVFAALPDGKTAVLLQHAVVPSQRIYLKECKGLMLQIPNDLFNGYKRSYFTEKGKLSVTGCSGKDRVISTGSKWLNAEGCISVVAAYGIDELKIFSNGKRTIGIKDKKEAGGMLCVDEIVNNCLKDVKSFDANSILYDLGVVLISGLDHKNTGAYVSAGAVHNLETGDPYVKAVVVKGLDKNSYLITSNFGAQVKGLEIYIPGAKETFDIANGKKQKMNNNKLSLSISSEAALLFKIKY